MLSLHVSLQLSGLLDGPGGIVLESVADLLCGYFVVTAFSPEHRHYEVNHTLMLWCHQEAGLELFISVI